MGHEIITTTPEDVTLHDAQFGTAQDSSDEAFLAGIMQNPGFRFQVAESLKTIHIPQHSVDALGYTTHPVTQSPLLIDYLNLGFVSDDRKKAIAAAVLNACLEVRDGLNVTLSGGEVVSQTDILSQAPLPVRFLAIAKACAGDQGSPFDPSDLASGSEKRKTLSTYMCAKLGFAVLQADTLLDAVAVVHGSKILQQHLSYGVESEHWRTLGAFPPEIIGAPAPRNGYLLPDAIEVALREGGIDLYHISNWDASWLRDEERAKNEEFKQGFEWLCGRVMELADKPADEKAHWQSYILTSILADQSFSGSHVEGFSGTYDQMVGWQEPLADEKHYTSYVYLMEQTEKARGFLTDFSEAGMLTALKGVAMRIGRGVEREIITGGKQSRGGRVRTVAEIYRQLRRQDPSEAAALLAAIPMIESHVKEAADPWGFRFE